jgi:hypothetical protein
MSQTVNAWFKEVIKDKVTIFMQNQGGFLDGTMMSGDVQANTVKFPVVTGTSQVYKLTGAIERVPVNNPGLGIVQVTMDDFEAAEWWRTQDAYKAGASEREALVELIGNAIRAKRDGIKLDAIQTFYLANTATIDTIGTGAEVPDVIHFETARALLETKGDKNMNVGVFCPIPSMWLTQLSFYKEWANSQYIGPTDGPFTMAMRKHMRTIRGVHYIMCPDTYFQNPTATQLETFMWRISAMGCEMPVNIENAQMSKHEELQGSPYLLKAPISGCAVGIEPAAVKRILLKKLDKTTGLTRPV